MPTRVLQYTYPLNCFQKKKKIPTSRLYTDLPLKIFGCTAYVHLPSQFQSKLDSRAEKCVFIGYAPNKKGYKCYNPTTKKTHVSMDVIFFLENTLFFHKNSLRREKQQGEDNFCITESLPKAILEIVSPSTSTLVLSE